MINRINFLKSFDKLFGGIASTLVKLLISPRKFQNKSIRRILVIRPGGIGDAVLLYPSLKLLKNEFNDSKIDILAENRNAGIFKSCKYIENLYLYDDLKNPGLFKALNNRYDVVIDTEQWHRLSSVVAYITRAPVRVGFATNKREALFSNTVEYRQDDYEAISFINLIKEFTGKEYKFDKNEAFLGTDGVPGNRDYIDYRKNHKTVVGIFSGATVKERKWGANNYSLVAEKLLENNIGVVLLGGKTDMKDSAHLERFLSQSDFLNLIGKTALDETINIISNLDLLISADSGLMHIACGVGTKTVSLFGAGIQEKWAPQGIASQVLNKNLSCSPCTSFGYTPNCPYNVRCLSEINVDEVFSKVMNSLGN